MRPFPNVPLRLYVAGPMTGVENHNFPLFFEVAGRLEALGYHVENPADNDGGTNWQEAYEAARQVTHTWEYYLRRDLKRVLSCDAIVVLPGWRNSRGAQLETHVAQTLGMPLYRLTDKGLAPLYEIIGLSGYAQSGKDTAAEVLVEQFGYERRAFADPLKQSVIDLNPIVDTLDDGAMVRAAEVLKYYRTFDAIKKSEFGEEFRVLWQRQGTEVGRKLRPSLWVESTFNSMEDGGKYVITDCRFPNEAEAIKNWGGAIWRITRAGVGPVNDHPSETSLDDYPWDREIRNNYDLPSFRGAVFDAASLREAVADGVVV